VPAVLKTPFAYEISKRSDPLVFGAL